MAKNDGARLGKSVFRYLVPRLTMLAFSILIVLLIGEGALRLAPQLLPKGHYGAGRIDEKLRLYVHASPTIYNKVRFVRRTPNAAGFMDIDHESPKPPGTTRIGFFGDSFVESIQVPLEQTFFSKLEAKLGNDRVETFSLGISGWGTLHSLIAYENLADEHELDVAVYVFVENDPGDNSYAVQKAQRGGPTLSPSAVLDTDPPGFEIRWMIPPDSLPLSFRFGKWIQSRSLLVKLLHSRLQLIAKQGAIPVNQSGEMLGSKRERVLDPNDLPSTWPPIVLAEAKELTERILAEFASNVRRDGRKAFVLYVPRGTTEVDGTLPESERWLPWLSDVTDQLGLTLFDPTSALRQRQAMGRPVYDDHWSPDGHEVIAQFLAESLCRLLPKLDCTPPPANDR